MTSLATHYNKNETRPRAWSMLDVREMEMIHALAEDMQSVYASNDAAARSSMSSSPNPQNMEQLTSNEESDYLLGDLMEDDGSVQQESLDKNRNNMSMNHNDDSNIQKLRKIRRNSKSFACGDASFWTRELDTAHHLRKELNLEPGSFSDSAEEDKTSVVNESLLSDYLDASFWTRELDTAHHLHKELNLEPGSFSDSAEEDKTSVVNESLLSDYLEHRKSQSSPDNPLQLMVMEDEEKKQDKSLTTDSPSFMRPSQKLPFMNDIKDVKSVEPSIKMPALLAPKTIPLLKPVVKPQSTISNNIDIDSSNGSGSSSIASQEKPKGILKKSGSIGTKLNILPNDMDSPNELERVEMKRTASFSTLEIRSYNITLGDNPGGSHGAPVSLGWDYNPVETVKVDLDTYEKTRPKRRERSEMYMSGSIRMFLLMKNQGFSLHDIEAAAKDAEKLRKQRLKTLKNEQIRQSIGRIFGRSK